MPDHNPDAGEGTTLPGPQSASAAQRLQPVDAATAFVDCHFPLCSVALLAGSVARGHAHPRSDLDVVVLSAGEQPRWATFAENGWPIELFVDAPETYAATFERQVQRQWPLLPILCVEGTILVDRNGQAQAVKDAATHVLAAGPGPLNDEDKIRYRHFLTVAYDDFADADDPDEARLLGHELATLAASCYLVSHRQWRGFGKWLLRSLRDADPAQARAFTHALAALDAHGEKDPLLQFVAATLQLVGGHRFEGYGEEW